MSRPSKLTKHMTDSGISSITARSLSGLVSEFRVCGSKTLDGYHNGGFRCYVCEAVFDKNMQRIEETK